MKRLVRTRNLIGLGVVALATAVALIAAGAFAGGHVTGAVADGLNNSGNTTTPIKHVVVIFDENESFDHYFGTYPYAANTDGTKFVPAPGTPGLPGSSETVNSELASGLLPSSTLGSSVVNANGGTVVPNPNAGGPKLIATDANATGSATTPNPNEYQPQRIPDTADVTCDNNHGYTQEEEAFDAGKMDDFVQYTASDCTIPGSTNSNPAIGMDYYDGNTASALWNYAQNYAISDNSWDTGFGPSNPGYLNSFGGTTHSTILGQTMISNTWPEFEDWGGQSWAMGGDDIGDLLNAKDVTWGWFNVNFDGSPNATSTNLNGKSEAEYNGGMNAMDYWQDTSNAAHTPPSSPTEVGFAGAANHNYDLSYFNDALDGTGGATLPAVSFIRPDQAQFAHPGVSGPLDEQEYLTTEINKIQQSPYWSSTAIVVEYDDSDGWYDHVAPTITNSSNTSSDSTICKSAATAGVPELGNESNRCGPGERLPYVVISPYAKKDYVDHTPTTQVSTLKFIEQNWNLGNLGPYTFDNTANGLDSFFDWQQPQQDEVILDDECQVPGLAVVTNTCNNTTANAATDGVTPDAGGVGETGFGAVQSTPAATVAAPPVETVTNSTISIPVSANATVPASTIVTDTGASINEGTLTVDDSGVDASIPGTYSATISGTYDNTAAPDDVLTSMSPLTVQVDIVPVLSVPKTTLTYEASNPPTAAQILSDSGASISGGTLAAPNLGGVNLATPGTYTVQITGAAAGEQAMPVLVTVTVIPAPAVTFASPTVDYTVGQGPSPAQVLADAGASINIGTLATPDLSGVNFTRPGSYTVTVNGSADGFNAAPATLTVAVSTTPAITFSKRVVSYMVGSSPSASQVLDDAGVQISSGTLSLDLSPVDFGQAGTYTARVSGNGAGAAATQAGLTVDVVSQPVVTLSPSVIDVPVGTTLSADQVLADAGATVSGHGIAGPVDLSGVNFNQAGAYTASVAGSLDGIAAAPAKLAIDVIGNPTVTVAHGQLSYPSGATVGAAEVLNASGAEVSDSGTAAVDLSTVNFKVPGNYAVQVTGTADGLAATAKTVTITIRPVISLRKQSLSYTAGAKVTAKTLLKAAGASISQGTLSSPSLKKVIFSEAGIHALQINGKAQGVAATAATLTLVIKPKLAVAHKRVKVKARTHLTAKALLRDAGVTLRGQGYEHATAKLGDVDTRKPGTYAAQIVVTGDHGRQLTASVPIQVSVTR